MSPGQGIARQNLRLRGVCDPSIALDSCLLNSCNSLNSSTPFLLFAIRYSD